MIAAANAVEWSDQIVSVQQFGVRVRGQKRKIGLHPDLILERDHEYEKSDRQEFS